MSGTTRNSIVQIRRTPTTNNPPPALELLDGELCIEQNDPMRLWVGVDPTLDPTGRKLIFDKNVALQGLLVEHDNSLAGDGTVGAPLTVVIVDNGTY